MKPPRALLNFFVDGFSIGKLTDFPINLNDSSADVVIGHDGNYGAGTSFNGLIDEIRVWNIAKNQGKIQNQQYEVLNASTTNLSAYWRLENNLNDRTNNGKNLSSHGSPAFFNEPAHKLLCGLNTMPLYVNQSTFTISCSVLGVS